ncbi:hypothetical protein [Nocardiopsis sp. YSL2]|uniref:hypothetical protein n=1 Tax=Nocardiopsis sp. YSL2 TaxID=2939492 RepID=UPI0026F45E14|nr:hypothetical protein [Nocardiopsis sp. YSL2]
MEVENYLQSDPRGPVREIATTERGVLVVFEEDVALFDTDPVGEVWSYSNLGEAAAAGVTADGRKVVVAFEGTGLLSHRARWLLLDASNGKTLTAHWSESSPSELVDALGAGARLVYSSGGQLEARSLDKDQALWSHELESACAEVHISAVGSTFTVATACEGEVFLVGLSADTGELLYEYEWEGGEAPELLPLTHRTMPGAEEDPLGRIVRESGSEKYLLMNEHGVDTSFAAMEYFPQPASEEQPPDFVVLFEDPSEVEYRMILASGHLFLERGLIDPETLESKGVMIDGELPEHGQEWGAGLVARSEDLHEILSDAVGEMGHSSLR